MGLDADLTAYNDAEALAGVRGTVDAMRLGIRTRFADLLRREGRHRLVDIGAGPGTDTVAFHHDGVDAVGVDLSPANVVTMCGRGAMGAAGSLYALPFPDAVFDALWTMSTFVHVPHDRFDEAMGELVRVVAPGAPLAIGTWGGHDFEGVPEFGDLRPYRFFSLATHARWRTMLERHGTLEHFETFPPSQPGGWEYQYAVLRADHRGHQGHAGLRSAGTQTRETLTALGWHSSSAARSSGSLVRTTAVRKAAANAATTASVALIVAARPVEVRRWAAARA